MSLKGGKNERGKIKNERNGKIDNGNSLKFKNVYYQPYENGQLKCFKPHTKALVIKEFNLYLK